MMAKGRFVLTVTVIDNDNDIIGTAHYSSILEGGVPGSLLLGGELNARGLAFFCNFIHAIATDLSQGRQLRHDG